MGGGTAAAAASSPAESPPGDDTDVDDDDEDEGDDGSSAGPCCTHEKRECGTLERLKLGRTISSYMVIKLAFPYHCSKPVNLAIYC